jgi:surface carbohydrate biosynthesis protein (TIGR04326 family)
MALRQQKKSAAHGGATLLVYGHPTSTADGIDGYFGDLLKTLPDLTRVLHVDCNAGRARTLAKDGRTISLHAWCRVTDALALIFARWRPQPQHKAGLNGWLVRRAAAIEGGTAQGAMIAWQQKCQRRWLNETRPRVVAWPWENHSWERDFVRAAHAQGVHTVGYQHSVIGQQMLNYSPASNPDGEGSLPQTIFCTGPATRQQLLDLGVPVERLQIGGALRFSDPPQVRFDAEGPVFIALPFDGETAGQMVAAARALTDKGFRFLIKDHPMTPFKFSSGNGLVRTDKPLQEHSGLRAVIYAATTVGLEAALAGLPTVRFRPEGRLSLNILPKGVDLPVTDAGGLEDALNTLTAPNLSRDQIFSPVSHALWQRTLAHD